MKLLPWILFLVIAALSVYIGFIHFDAAESGLKFSVFGYWNILVCFILFCAILYRTYGEEIRVWICDRKNWIIIGAAIASALFLYTREGGGFKITFDEQIIANVSKNLHFERAALYKESSLQLIDETASVDKRPILFHFLVASVHDIFGYDYANSFPLNGALTVIFLLLLYVLARHLLDERAGWLAIALACASPIIGQNSSGGGLEVTNLIGILATFLLAIRYAEKPDSIERFSCLIIAVALFSHARYESPILVIPAICVIAINWIRMRTLQISWIAVIAPLFFIPIAWQHKYVDSRPDFKQLQNEGDPLFGATYLFENLGHAANFLFTHNRFLASTPLVATIGVLSLVSMIALNLTRNKEWSQCLKTLYVAQVFGITLIAEFLLILSFSYGQLDDPIVTRLGLPFITLTIICAAIGLSIIASAAPKGRAAVYIAVAACLFYSINKYSNHLYTSNNMLLKRVDWVLDRHERLPTGNYLYISTLSQDLEVRNIGNISVKRAIAKAGSLELHRELKTFDEIFVIQFFGERMVDGGVEQFVLSGHDLGPWYELETVDEVSMLPMNLTRLSRVTGIRSSIDEEIGEDEIKESLLQAKTDRIYDISMDAYNIWLGTLP